MLFHLIPLLYREGNSRQRRVVACLQLHNKLVPNWNSTRCLPTSYLNLVFQKFSKTSFSELVSSEFRQTLGVKLLSCDPHRERPLAWFYLVETPPVTRN